MTGEFVDEVTVTATAGRGGDGVTAFDRQPYEPKGRPDGGDGGHGGDVVVRASKDEDSLLDLRYRPHRAAGRGRHGSGDRRRGADGDACVLTVPEGTIVSDADHGEVLADLARDGDEVVVARGGRGGRGNAALAGPRRRAPRFHELGEPGEQRRVRCELKLLADVALVGMPSAGKSSLIAHVSAARPKVAAYPFTTLTPRLGVVRVDETDFTIADVPGLIEGASEGRGLGQRFLRHIERAAALVHVLDCASLEGRDPREDLAIVHRELAAYEQQAEGLPGRPPLTERPALVLLNKVDADREVAELVRPDLEAQGWEVLLGSAVTGEGLTALLRRLAELVRAERAVRAVSEEVAPRGPVLRPVAEPEPLRVVREGHAWRVRGGNVDRWIAQTDFGNEEAVAHLQRRLRSAGAIDALARAGARAGDDVVVGDVVFDFEPPPDAADDDAPAPEPEPDDAWELDDDVLEPEPDDVPEPELDDDVREPEPDAGDEAEDRR